MQPLLERVHGAGLILRAATDLDFAPAGFGIEAQEGAFLHNLDPPATVGRIVFVHVQADDFRAAQASGVSQKKDCPISQPAQIIGQGGDHCEDVFRQDCFLLHLRSRVLTLDPGQHRGDVTVLAIESEPPLRVVPSEA